MVPAQEINIAIAESVKPPVYLSSIQLHRVQKANKRIPEPITLCNSRGFNQPAPSPPAPQVALLLNGSVEPEPQQHGMTTDEERMASRSPQWPGLTHPVKPQNSQLRLFGGAAFERCLNEFQEAAQGLKFPAVARDKVANVLLAYRYGTVTLCIEKLYQRPCAKKEFWKGPRVNLWNSVVPIACLSFHGSVLVMHLSCNCPALTVCRGKNNMSGPARAAEDIARETAKDLLCPLLDCACSRLSYVIRRVFDIAADRAMSKSSTRDNLQPYVAFHAALRAAHQNFVNKLELQVSCGRPARLPASSSPLRLLVGEDACFTCSP